MPKLRIFKTRNFNRWLIKSNLSDEDLLIAVDEMKYGLIDAYLGGNIFKKRVACSGRGKSNGVRTIVASKLSNHWFFIYGFTKNEKTNINKTELRYLQEIAKTFLGFNLNELNIAINSNELLEIKNDSDKA